MRQTQRIQHRVDDAVALQKRHHRVGAQQEVHPHRQKDEYENGPPAGKIARGEKVGRRIADQQADERAEKGQPEAVKHHRQVAGAEKPAEVLRGEGAVAGGEGEVDHEQKRHDGEDQHPQGVGGRVPAALHASPPPSTEGRVAPSRRMMWMLNGTMERPTREPTGCMVVEWTFQRVSPVATIIS